MTNLVDHLKAPPRADRAAIDDLGFMISDLDRTREASGRPIRNQKSAIRNPTAHGLTLIEMLVALAVTLVMMAAVVNLFANMTGSIRNRRAAIEAGAQLRQVRQRLALDLQGATSKGIPWQDPAENQGYIEIIEGNWSDQNPSSLFKNRDADGLPTDIDSTISLIPSSQKIRTDLGQVTDGAALGDWDDILALTVRSESDPFVGVDTTLGGVTETVESPLAEVVWFANERPVSTPDPDAYDGMRTVYRRVLLIAPWRGPWNDRPRNISAHYDQTRNQWVANTLADVTKRENRACRDEITDFPHTLDRGHLLGSGIGVEAVALSNTLAFDVRIFDPGAPLFPYAPRSMATVPANAPVMQPGDPGWVLAMEEDAARSTPNGPVGYGAYCDLGWGVNPADGTNAYPQSAWPNDPKLKPLLLAPRQAGWHPRMPDNLLAYPAVYDTWSYHYENDGIDQDGMPPSMHPSPHGGTIDQGTNGLDDDGINGVDDKGERETSPPYDTPLLGVKVIFRVYERDARQIREASVTHSFKP